MGYSVLWENSRDFYHGNWLFCQYDRCIDRDISMLVKVEHVALVGMVWGGKV